MNETVKENPTDLLEQFRKLQDQYNAGQKFTASPCPSCGTCPTCGRGGHRAAPFYVGPPWITWTSTGGYNA